MYHNPTNHTHTHTHTHTPKNDSPPQGSVESDGRVLTFVSASPRATKRTRTRTQSRLRRQVRLGFYA
jgi:hypothetical protein